MASLFLTLAVITTGLYAGFLLTFLIAVMPGLAALPDGGFTAAMRRFNEKVPRPGLPAALPGASSRSRPSRCSRRPARMSGPC